MAAYPRFEEELLREDPTAFGRLVVALVAPAGVCGAGTQTR